MPRRAPDPQHTRAALAAVVGWVDGSAERPPRAVVADAVRASLRTLEHAAPGRSVEVRVPPFGAVQCVEGPRHTRGTPPNVVEIDPATWLALATGRLNWADARATARVSVSGHRADDVARWLPVAPLPRSGDES